MMCPFFICDFVETDRALWDGGIHFHDTGTFAVPYLISTDIFLRSAAKLRAFVCSRIKDEEYCGFVAFFGFVSPFSKKEKIPYLQRAKKTI